MTESLKPQSSALNGPLWGSRAQDWAEVQEATARAAYKITMEQTQVGADTAYLDVGCGSGMAAELAAALGARVAGIDAAEPLLAIARGRVPDGDFRCGDLESLPFANECFDVVTGFNAFQYAANPVMALAEARRVTRPGGAVVMMVWGKPEGMPMASVIKALGPLLPAPPPGAGGPFALSDEAALRALAESAGLKAERIFDVEQVIHYPDLVTALRGLNSSGVAAKAMQTVGEDAVTRAHSEALAQFATARGAYEVGAVFRCLLARA